MWLCLPVMGWVLLCWLSDIDCKVACKSERGVEMMYSCVFLSISNRTPRPEA